MESKTENIEKRQVLVEQMDQLMSLFGARDENFEVLREELGVDISARGNALEIVGGGEGAAAAEAVIQKLLVMMDKGEAVDRSKIRYAIELSRTGDLDRMEELMRDVIAVTARGRQVKAKTLGQRQYVDAIKKNECVFAVGPAGTGKTYLAVAMAVLALKNKEIERIILTRPAVEAGEHLGFLPGDLAQKVDPYLRPLYDALHEMVGVEAYQRLVERSAVEVAPLAYMRGRTLNDAFIILDEAQNTTSEQMKMFLTRMGMGSRMVITGDVTQIDLPSGKRSGLVEAVDILKNVKGIGMIKLTHRDVVRHDLVQAIVKAYERHQARRR